MTEDELRAKRWLRQLRTDQKLSQRALAELVGVHRRTILNAESEGEDAGFPEGFTLLRMLQQLGAVVDAPVSADSPLAVLEAKLDEVIVLTTEALELLREDRPPESEVSPAGS